MPSQTAAIWAGATGAAAVVAGAVAVYWAHPKFIWPSPDAVAVSERTPEALAPAVAAAPTPKEPSAAPNKPAFDVVSVEPTGEAVIAGRAAPNAKVELKDSGRTVAEATANAEGQFVMIPPPLPPGEHSLALSTGAGASSQTSNAVNVAVAAPKAAAASAAPPPASSTALAVPAASGPAPSVQGAAGGLSVRSIEASPGGRLIAEGAAPPNAVVRLYLGAAYIGDAKTGAGGRWSLTIEHGMTPGAYKVRADEINRSDAKVAARVEAPFDYPAAAAAAPTPAGAAHSSPSPADVVVVSILTHPVEEGNTLWGISQKYYGDGSHYEAIFAANSDQIRNPNLIYPGQVFVVPKPAPKP